MTSWQDCLALKECYRRVWSDAGPAMSRPTQSRGTAVPFWLQRFTGDAVATQFFGAVQTTVGTGDKTCGASIIARLERFIASDAETRADSERTTADCE